VRISTPPQPTLPVSIAQLLHVFLTDKYISDPAILGLRNFSIDELVNSSFERTGDRFYCLYEKGYQLAESPSQVNIKLYFHEGEFISNGVDVSHGRLSTALSDFCRDYGVSTVGSIELFLDDSLNYGSLILNNFLDLRFGKLGNPKRKKRFHLTGISTDYELPLNGTERGTNTRAARSTKSRVSFHSAPMDFKRSPAVSELMACLVKNFPAAVFQAGDAGTRPRGL
jgi:hypothetical protein